MNDKTDIGLILYYNPDYLDGDTFLIFIHNNRLYVNTQNNKSYKVMSKPDVDITIDNIDLYASNAGFIKVLDVSKSKVFEDTKGRIRYYNELGDEVFIKSTNLITRLESCRQVICKNTILQRLYDHKLNAFQHMMSVLIDNLK